MTPSRAAIFVLDTGPLITLAAADSLDYLLYPSVPVIVPDAVFYEATRDATKLGAHSIIDWVKANRTVVEIAITEAYSNFEAAQHAKPGVRSPNLGEQSAIEVIEEPDRLQGNDKAVLLCEETAVTRRIVVLEREKLIEVTTMDFLKLLEAERRIQSAEAVFERAVAAGRTASRVEKFGDHDPSVRDAVRAILRQS